MFYQSAVQEYHLPYFINPLFKNITYHILSLPLAMRLKDERRNAACLFSFPHRVSICRLYM
ncbi:hypothetical protein CDG35_003189 [Salmonella enterica subsp. enterica serovar Cerro]|nr:hypothetical protein [Salmonella enterica subsp. enterica serovar Cerro]EDR4572267.1 hypothetical protein [Salmonella enterica subsp. enterica serovar Cerro]